MTSKTQYNARAQRRHEQDAMRARLAVHGQDGAAPWWVRLLWMVYLGLLACGVAWFLGRGGWL